MPPESDWNMFGIDYESILKESETLKKKKWKAIFKLWNLVK